MLSRCWAYVGAVLTKFRAEACYEGRFVGQFDLHLHDASAPSVRAGLPSGEIVSLDIFPREKLFL